MKLGIVAFLMALGSVPCCLATFRRHHKRKSPAPTNSMAANLQHAATESVNKNLRARLAADEKEIAYQKERADSQEKLVDTLASRLDLEERRMARFIMRVNELEQKVGRNTTDPSPKVQVSPRALSPPGKNATADIKVPSESSKLPAVVKLAHSEISPKAAKALESKHTHLDESSKKIPDSNASHVDDNVIPEADTLTAVDTEGMAKSDEEDLGTDDVSEALENEVMSEDNVSSSSNVAKTAVVRLAHKTVPAMSSSEEPKSPASTSPDFTPPPAPKVAAVPPVSSEPSKTVGVPPPPAPQVDPTRASASPAGVLGAPPISQPMAKVPPPPAAQVEDADMVTDSESETSDSEDVDTTDSDEAAEDELKKDDEALASDTSSENDKTELDNADQEISSEEHELDSEEAAVAEDERKSASSESEDVDEEAV